jgi:photosystem II stability/assembly factor-like uncharacterized protein
MKIVLIGLLVLLVIISGCVQDSEIKGNQTGNETNQHESNTVGDCQEINQECCMGDYCVGAYEEYCSGEDETVFVECDFEKCLPVLECKRIGDPSPPPIQNNKTGDNVGVSEVEKFKENLKEYGAPCLEDTSIGSIVIDHSDTNVIYATMRTWGMLKTTNGGDTWSTISNGILTYPDESDTSKLCFLSGILAMNPSNSNRVLFAPGDVSMGTINDPYSETAGVWETLDGGNSWHQLVHGDMNAAGNGALAIDPNNPQIIYYGTGHDIATHSLADPDNYFTTVGALHKTTDGGVTWEELETGVLEGLLGIRVFIDKDNSDNLIFMSNAHTHELVDNQHWEIPGEEQFSVQKSFDGGKTWTSLADNLPEGYRMIFDGDVSPENFDHIYVKPDYWIAYSTEYQEQKSFYSLDGGQTFKETGSYVSIARYDPHDEDGNHMIGYSPLMSSGTLMESNDGGATWVEIGKPAELQGYSVGLYDIEWDPIDPDTIYIAGSNAYIWKSVDGGQTWTSILNNEKLPERI